MRWIRKSPCPGTVSTFIAAVNIQLSLLMILINFGYIKKRILQFIKKRVHKRERGACVSAEERSVYSLADSHGPVAACKWIIHSRLSVSSHWHTLALAVQRRLLSPCYFANEDLCTKLTTGKKVLKRGECHVVELDETQVSLARGNF